MSFRFYKAEHLKSRKTIAEVFSRRQSVAAFPVRLLWIEMPADTVFGYHKPPESLEKQEFFVQMGFSVPKRKIKLANDRNRLKRQLREAYRLQKNELATACQSKNKKIACIFLYADDKAADTALIHQKVNACLRKLIQAL